jgi:hypothetical protein
MTIEVTKERDLTPRGDCIIGVNASKACSDLPETLKSRLRDTNSIVQMTIVVDGMEYGLRARGSPDLILAHKHDIVIRKSAYICPRTFVIRCDGASSNMPREMVCLLKDPYTKGMLLVSVE